MLRAMRTHTSRPLSLRSPSSRMRRPGISAWASMVAPMQRPEFARTTVTTMVIDIWGSSNSRGPCRLDVLADETRGAVADEHARRVHRRHGDAGHRRGVGDPDAAHPAEPQPRVDG